jgi:hypothetical protein
MSVNTCTAGELKGDNKDIFNAKIMPVPNV